MATKPGNVVQQAIAELSSPLGPGDPREIAWVQAGRAAFAKWLAKEWAKGPDLDRIYVVALYDTNKESREKARSRRATPAGKAKSDAATARYRAKQARS